MNTALLLLVAIAGAGAWLALRRRAPRDAAPEATAVRAAEAPPAPVPEVPAGEETAAPEAVAPAQSDAAAPLPALATPEIFTRLYELALGPRVREPPPGLEQQALRQDAAHSCAALATDPRYAMRRPMLLPQLLREVNDRNGSHQRLVKIIGRDPALAGSLLKIANSPAYRAQDRPVESLERAVALLGTDGLHSLIAVALVQPIFRVGEPGFAAFPQLVWDHTFKSARATEAWAAAVDPQERFTAQLLALIMGLATIVTFRIVSDRSRVLLGGRPVHPAILVDLLASQVPAVAARVAASWELSDRVLTAFEAQLPATADGPSGAPAMLGRALLFGRQLGALALLHAQGGLDRPTLVGSIRQLRPLPAGFDALWARLAAPETAGAEGAGAPVRSRPAASILTHS